MPASLQENESTITTSGEDTGKAQIKQPRCCFLTFFSFTQGQQTPSEHPHRVKLVKGLRTLWFYLTYSQINFRPLWSSSVTQSCLTLCDPMDCSPPGVPVHLQCSELAVTHVHWVSDTIQPSHPLSSPSPPAFNLSQHQGLFKRVSSSHQVAKILEFQRQHQSFQWIFRTDFL